MPKQEIYNRKWWKLNLLFVTNFDLSILLHKKTNVFNLCFEFIGNKIQ